MPTWLPLPPGTVEQILPVMPAKAGKLHNNEAGQSSAFVFRALQHRGVQALVPCPEFAGMTNYSGHPQGIPLWGKRGGAGASPGWGFIFVAASPEVFLVAGWPA